ncbi:MAG: lipopolysaccharide biosynthesis protein [Geobacteraceae bacterium]|nr:lipopolysaccharide biosynthesis protein [Geobacteraceae bacterium]NTW79514.1 lipopolysaccharide biosynthesis protein [Geobacteraceae bacterium]
MDEVIQKNHDQNEIPAEDEINLLELLQVLVRRRALIIRLTLAAAFLAVVYSLLLPNIYTATAKILPPQKDSGGGTAAALLGQLGGLGGGLAAGLGGSSDLYLGILKSRSVADAVILRMDLATELKNNNPDLLRKAIAAMVKFQAGKDGIITVTADHKDPRKAAMLAHTFVDELQRKSLQLNLTKAGTERQFLEKRLAVVKIDLKKAEEDLRTFQEKSSMFKADDQIKASIESIAKLQAQIVTIEVQLAAARQNLTDESPEVRSLLASLAQLKKQLAVMTGVSGSGGGIPSIGSAPAIGIEYFRKLREFKTQEAIHEQLTRQFELAKLNEARDSSSLQVLDDAVVPSNKSKPKRSLIVILATVTAFFCSIFLVFIKEYLAKLSPEDSAMVAEMKGTLKGMLRRKKQF